MMEGLEDNEIEQYLAENPKIIPLFEIDVMEIIPPYISNENIFGYEVGHNRFQIAMRE